MLKKLLIQAAGLIMLIASAMTANAASQIDFSGHGCSRLYVVAIKDKPKIDRMIDAYWQHRLEISLICHPANEMATHWRVWVPGPKHFGDVNYRSYGNQGGTTMVADFAYGQIRLDWGLVFSAEPAGGADAYGLASPGYRPKNIFGFRAAVPVVIVKTGVTFPSGEVSRFEPVEPPNGLYFDDQDFDRYRLEAEYSWDGGGTE